ncbi:MAG: RbsD/FucU domain-containing protein [Rhizobiaceae bacterium]
MLKGLNPILGPELLHTLRAMGHGDEIAIVDGNYPAVAHARRLIRADGHHAPPILDAILSVMPIDEAVSESIFIPHHDQTQACHTEFKAICARHEPKQGVHALKGQAFYDKVKSAYAIVATSEPALYANIILRKGVIYPA